MKSPWQADDARQMGHFLVGCMIIAVYFSALRPSGLCRLWPQARRLSPNEPLRSGLSRHSSKRGSDGGRPNLNLDFLVARYDGRWRDNWCFAIGHRGHWRWHYSWRLHILMLQPLAER